MATRNGLKRMLVDNRRLVNILFGTTFEKMSVDHKLTPITSSLYGFIGEIIILRGRLLLQ